MRLDCPAVLKPKFLKSFCWPGRERVPCSFRKDLRKSIGRNFSFRRWIRSSPASKTQCSIVEYLWFRSSILCHRARSATAPGSAAPPATRWMENPKAQNCKRGALLTAPFCMRLLSNHLVTVSNRWRRSFPERCWSLTEADSSAEIGRSGPLHRRLSFPRKNWHPSAISSPLLVSGSRPFQLLPGWFAHRQPEQATDSSSSDPETRHRNCPGIQSVNFACLRIQIGASCRLGLDRDSIPAKHHWSKLLEGLDFFASPRPPKLCWLSGRAPQQRT